MRSGPQLVSIEKVRALPHFFFAGTSAGLMAGRKSRHELAAFLVERGLWLVFVEVVIISTAYPFSPFEGVPELGGQTLLALQVIWAIGASMVVLAGAQYLGVRMCGLAQRHPGDVRARPRRILYRPLHLIRLGRLALASFKGLEPEQMMTLFFFFPAGYGVYLLWIYLIWLLVVAMLYPFCIQRG